MIHEFANPIPVVVEGNKDGYALYVRDGGCDIRLGQFVLEVKRRKSIAVYDWIDQAKAACAPPYEVPVVVCRGDKREFLVIQRLDDWMKMAKHELPDR